ncbi:unnamed protein product [Clonostachys chloroleuca]|uniref:Aminoglycoside phosphotransferase domain-containing protein n=1 Tax=Clonostachys chloroleuca TaxID=1926264 RepID=A0AA35Q5A1_9HYPO|nr:unnamed protein product [Clonostachys chloroleuca]
MSEALKDPSLGPDEPHEIDPNIRDHTLKFLYRPLSRFKFDQIGSLVRDEQGNFSASGRPLIQNMNSIIDFTDAHPELLPSNPYTNSEDWYKALVDMHFLQYTFQHDDAVKKNDGEQSVYDAYVGRQLLRNLAADGRLATGLGTQMGKTEDSQYDFRLYSEDLRPSNVLIDANLNVVADLDDQIRARNSWNFEFPFWRFLDPESFGPGNEAADYHARLSLLSEPQRRMMREFVAKKLEESNVRELIDWDTHDAETHLKRFLI